MKNKKIWMAVGAVAVIAIVAWALSGGKKEETVEFETAKAERQNIHTTITATGTIEPVTSVTVGTQVSGIVSKLYVDYNSVVKKGQIIAELDKTNLTSELNRAKADLTSAESTLNYETANFQRYQTLFDKGLVSANDYENAKLSYQKARQAVASSKESVQKAQTNLGYATITSPIDGVVLSKSVEEGQTVAASFNTPELFNIAQDLTDMRVIADIDEADIGGVKEGQRVSFTVDAFPDDKFDGQVTQVRQQATTTSNVVTYEVVISAPNKDLKLKPGLTANVTIYTLEKNDVLAVPSKALRFIPNEALLKKGEQIEDVEAPLKVWTLEGNTFKAHKVETGTTNGMLTEIVSGISEGTDVLVDFKISGGEQEQSQQSQNPFMPRPRNNKQQQGGAGGQQPKMNEEKKVVIELQNVKRYFQVGSETVKALRGVSFKIYEGEFVTIQGTSGSGKSTLLNQLGCLDTPTSGEYLLDGISVRSMSKTQRAHLRNRKIGFVFQNYNLLAKTTAVENVELPLMYNSEVSAEERHERAIKALQAVGLGDRLYHKSNQMSGGQMQRVAIARALVNDPAVLLADEATGNLDTRTSFEMLVLFQELYRQGHTIIFVTHNPEIAEYSSRNINLRDGKIREDTVNNNIKSAAEALAALPAPVDD